MIGSVSSGQNLNVKPVKVSNLNYDKCMIKIKHLGLKKANIRRTCRIMRVFFLFFMLGIGFCFSNNSYSQSTKISLNLKNKTVKQVFSEIEKNSEFIFFYQDDIIDVNRRVTVNADNETIEQVLDEILSATGNTYFVSDRSIYIIKKGSDDIAYEEDVVQQQKKQVSGKVVDKDGEAIIGANIVEKGTTNGTVTDVDGRFSLSVGNDAVLQISYIGYLTKELLIDKNSNSKVDVVLQEDTQSLEELVVVGYGTQKKINMTGAVESIDVAKVSESRPVTSLSAGLSGLSSGLYVNQGGAQPGSDGATLLIRGQGTLNDSSPLVIIDGMEGNMNNLNPQDVETISILKDAASSSIYGSRAANGVILITTKKGKAGSLKMNYNAFFSSVKPSNLIETVSNYADYMELINEGYKNTDPNAKQIFSQEMIDLWRENEKGDQLKYPNTDWTKEVFQNNLIQNHNLSFSGGTEKIRFYGSVAYLNNPGIIERSTYERFTGRLNLDADIKPWLTLGMNVNGIVGNTDIGTQSISSVFTYAAASSPGMVLRAPDGRYGSKNNPEESSQLNNVLAILNNKDGEIKNKRFTGRLFGALRPIKGLSLEGSFNFNFTDRVESTRPVFNDLWDFLTDQIVESGGGETYVNNTDVQDEFYTMDVVAKYENTLFDKLNYNIMLGASQESYKWWSLTGRRYDLIDMSLKVLNAAVGDANAWGSADDWAMRSYFTRLNLNWDEKYLFEFNLRRDGSSRFNKTNRWGTFPSFSGGWRINKEGFMEDIHMIDNLKLRFSWGALGNNSVGNYEYQSLYTDMNYILNNQVIVGFGQSSLANANLTWESTYVSNIGIDFGLLKNKLTGSVDIFDKTTKNILINLPAPLVVGNYSIPKQNSASVRNRGIELSLGWNDRIDDFQYYIGGNFTYIDNKIVKFKGEEKSISDTNLLLEGYPINVQYVLAVDRILQTEEDMAIVQKMIDNAPLDEDGKKRNPFAAYGKPELGDFLYKDMNNDGIINDDDRYMVGHGTAPRITYGVNMGFDWKNIDFAILIQGNAGLKVHWSDMYYRPVVNWGYQINKEIAEGRWYEGRTDATYPRLLNDSKTINMRPSDFWVQDKSYMRLKNIQLGYTIPKEISGKLSLESARIYGSMENYFTFTKYKGFDPEVSGTNYPTLKQVLFGVNLTF